MYSQYNLWPPAIESESFRHSRHVIEHFGVCMCVTGRRLILSFIPDYNL